MTLGIALAALSAFTAAPARYTIARESAGGSASPQVVVLRDGVAGLEAAVAPSEGGELSSLKVRFRGGPHGEPNDLCHFNMFHMAQEVYPDLAVIDGFTGMEGDGPSRGTSVDSRIALASADPLAADTLGARLMGFDPKKILYLSALAQAGMGQGNPDKITVLGARPQDCSYRFAPSPLVKVPPTLSSL